MLVELVGCLIWQYYVDLQSVRYRADFQNGTRVTRDDIRTGIKTEVQDSSTKIRRKVVEIEIGYLIVWSAHGRNP